MIEDKVLRGLLRSYYFVEWSGVDDCISTLLPDIKAHIAQDYIPKRKISIEGIYSKLYVLLYYFIDEMSGARGEKELRKVAQNIYKALEDKR